MIKPFLAVVAIFLLLLLAEYLWRKKLLSPEPVRKLVHITVGVFVAFWPYFMSWTYIELISLAFIVVVLASSLLNIFKSIRSVKRSMSGELLFAIAIAALAFFFQTKWLFTLAMLHLGLADGMAAIIGTRYGKKLRYTVAGNYKSFYGTATFFIISFLIVLVVGVTNKHVGAITLLWLPLLATLTENLAIYGTDNIFIPLVVALSLRWS